MDALRRVDDPARRLTAAVELIDELQTARTQVIDIRDETMRELVAAGHSYGQVAKLAGVSRGRVAQVLGKVQTPGR